MIAWIIVITVIALLWLIALVVLSGENLQRFETPLEDAADRLFNAHTDDAEETHKVVQQLQKIRHSAAETKSIKKGFQLVREFADNLSSDLVTDTQFIKTIANGVPCEWAIAPDANPRHRIVFMHGGAFIFGSPRGHRKMTDQLSRLSKAAVLSVDYRLQPACGRKSCIEDVQQAYLWALENGPDIGTENEQHGLDFLMVAGDSAGGNLALILSSWSQHNAPRRPDGVIGFSPSIDQTMASPTLHKNRNSDKMLGEGLGLLMSLPWPIRRWVLLILMRANPASPKVSPIFNNLADLPPTLLHASSTEMLLGDSIRYANKAKAAGSDVRLQVWQNQIHDWHLMTMNSGSAHVAWNEIAKFIAELKDKLCLTEPETNLNIAESD